MNPTAIAIGSNIFSLIEHYLAVSYDNGQFELYNRPTNELVATGQVISRGGDNISAVVTKFEGACLLDTVTKYVQLSSWCKCRSVFSMYNGNNKSNVVCHYNFKGSQGTVTGVYVVEMPTKPTIAKEPGLTNSLRGI
jgi:hypothetical protein